jgi:hypothetical protein
VSWAAVKVRGAAAQRILLFLAMFGSMTAQDVTSVPGRPTRKRASMPASLC